MLDIQLNKRYKDRKGRVWTIISTTSQKIAPIVGARWMQGHYETRTFQRDGSFWRSDRPDPWDLISEV